MTDASKGTVRERILKEIDFISEHWVMGDDRPPFSFGGWREECASALERIVSEAVSEARRRDAEAIRGLLTLRATIDNRVFPNDVRELADLLEGEAGRVTNNDK